MEKTIAANARMLALAGHLNRKDSPGIRHGKTLMMRPKSEAIRPQTDDDKVGLGSFGMKAVRPKNASGRNGNKGWSRC